MTEADVPIDCVIPAAGASTRMGRQKLLLPFGGATVVETTVANALEAGLRVILVLGPGEVAASIRALFEGSCGEIAFARNGEPTRGMLSSIQEGVRLVRSGRFFIIPADMPMVLSRMYRRLLESEAAGPVFPRFEGSKGHPVLIPSRLIPSILQIPPSEPLRPLLASSSPSYFEVPDDSILRDLDTEEDYRRAMEGN
jgi:molybdenum cofactor cytidylyltransferase